MSRMVNCILLKREAAGLERLTYPGDLGQRIFDNVSQEGWSNWVKQQTILMNEYRLSPINPKDRKFLEEEMDKFFFGTGASQIDNFVPKI